jgi:mRNA degradation ribonuclease J1/J2
MTSNFLLFRGNWENQGNIHCISSENSIILIATGQDYSNPDPEEQQLALEYLKENHSKIKGIFVGNTSFRNSGLLFKFCQEIGQNIQIYTNAHNKLILNYLFPLLKNKIQIIDFETEVQIGDFSCSLFPLNSHLLGNSLVAIHHSENSFYFLEDLLLSSYWENNLLFRNNFLTDLKGFLSHKRENAYLISSFSNLKWKSNNSLLLNSINFFSPRDNNKVWIFYEFDWLHIFELIQFANLHNKKVQILNDKFLFLLRQTLLKSPLGRVLTGEKGDYVLLVVSYNNFEDDLNNYLSSLDKNKFQFMIGFSPAIGSESKIARIIDSLHIESEKIFDFSRFEQFKYHNNLNEWRLVFRLLNPKAIIALQNTYKNFKHFENFSGKIISLSNQQLCQFPSEKIYPIKCKKNLTTLDEILVRQRKNLWDEGVLMILLIVSWKDEKLGLKKIEINSLGISSVVNSQKLEKKIMGWWSKKITYKLKISDSTKIIKEAIKRRLNELVKNYLAKEHEIDLEELPILLFFK